MGMTIDPSYVPPGLIPHAGGEVRTSRLGNPLCEACCQETSQLSPEDTRRYCSNVVCSKFVMPCAYDCPQCKRTSLWLSHKEARCRNSECWASRETTTCPECGTPTFGGACAQLFCIEKAKARGEGVKMDAGKPDWTLLPFDSLEVVVRVMEYGQRKGYPRDNWRKLKNQRWRYLKSAIGHLASACRGEWLDPDSNLPHVAHAACCCLFLVVAEESK